MECLGLMQRPAAVDFGPDRVRGERHHGDAEIVSRRVEGDIHRYTYARTLPAGPASVANALDRPRSSPFGDRVGDAGLEWLPALRAVLRRLAVQRPCAAHASIRGWHPDQIAWIANHAEDQVLCFDLSFLPLVQGGTWRQMHHHQALRSRCARLTNCRPIQRHSEGLQSYESLDRRASAHTYDWPSIRREQRRFAVFAIPAARPVTRKPRSTAIGQARCCTAYACRLARCDVRCLRGMRSCRSCPCFTSMHGVSRIRRGAYRLPSWCFPGRRSTANRSLS